MTPEHLNRFGQGYLPDRFGIVVTHVDGPPAIAVTARLEVCKSLMSPNDCLHGGAVMVLADTAAGYGCLCNLPPGVVNFLTCEMKANHLAAVREGAIVCVASPVHLGRTTQVWDAVVTQAGSGKRVALFRCTQLLLYAQPG